jgi:hypothetical protein
MEHDLVLCSFKQHMEHDLVHIYPENFVYQTSNANMLEYHFKCTENTTS